MHEIGLIFSNLEKYDKAKELIERLLEIKRNILPENHQSIAFSLHDLGYVSYCLGDKLRSIELYEQALDMKILTLPKNHKLIAYTMHGLGCVYYSLGDYDKAEEFLKKALEILRKNYVGICPHYSKHCFKITIFPTILRLLFNFKHFFNSAFFLN